MKTLFIDAACMADARAMMPFSRNGWALSIGNFDGVHRGHRMLLQRVRAAAEERHLGTALLTFEPHPREYFSPEAAPLRLTSLEEKAALLEQERLDLLVVARFNQAMAELSAGQFVEAMLIGTLDVRHLVIGDDFCFGHRRQGDIRSLQAAATGRDFVVEAMDTLSAGSERVSSTLIRKCIAEGDFARAHKLLGRWPSVDALNSLLPSARSRYVSTKR